MICCIDNVQGWTDGGLNKPIFEVEQHHSEPLDLYSSKPFGMQGMVR